MKSELATILEAMTKPSAISGIRRLRNNQGSSTAIPNQRRNNRDAVDPIEEVKGHFVAGLSAFDISLLLFRQPSLDPD